MIVTGMPLAAERLTVKLALIVPARGAVAVGLSTETESDEGEAATAIAPPISNRMLPGRRRVVIEAGAPAAAVVTKLTMARPLPDGAMLIPAASPLDGPGVTVTLTAFSLYCSALTPAA